MTTFYSSIINPITNTPTTRAFVLGRLQIDPEISVYLPTSLNSISGGSQITIVFTSSITDVYILNLITKIVNINFNSDVPDSGDNARNVNNSASVSSPNFDSSLNFNYGSLLSYPPTSTTYMCYGNSLGSAVWNSFQGYQGIQGFIGIQGVQGVQGTTGQQGFQGSQGFQGQQGIQGFQGQQGFIGLQGIQGIQGIQGFQGQQGSVGTQGFQGSQGFQGQQGFIGLQGIQGFQGQQGFIGLQGIQGFQGQQGSVGNQGSQGFQGQQGFIGLQGIQGIQGIQGFQGFQGQQGQQGSVGTQGFQGDQGFQGFQGRGVTPTYVTAYRDGSSSGAISLGTTTTTVPLVSTSIAAASSGSWSISGGGLVVPVAGVYEIYYNLMVTGMSTSANVSATLVQGLSNISASQCTQRANSISNILSLTNNVIINLSVNDNIKVQAITSTGTASSITSQPVYLTPNRPALIVTMKLIA